VHRQLMGGAESVSTDFKQGQERSQCAEEEIHHRGSEGTKFLWGTRGHTLRPLWWNLHPPRPRRQEGAYLSGFRRLCERWRGLGSRFLL